MKRYSKMRLIVDLIQLAIYGPLLLAILGFGAYALARIIVNLAHF